MCEDSESQLSCACQWKSLSVTSSSIMKEKATDAPFLVRSEVRRLHRDRFFCRMANGKICSTAENTLLPVIVQAAPRVPFLSKSISSHHTPLRSFTWSSTAHRTWTSLWNMAFDALPKLAPTSLCRHGPATLLCAAAAAGQRQPRRGTPRACSWARSRVRPVLQPQRSPTPPHLAKPSSPSPSS